MYKDFDNLMVPIQRLRTIGEIFLNIEDPEGGRTQPILVESLDTREDALLPEYHNPPPDMLKIDLQYREENMNQRAKPTSIKSVSNYYVMRGQNPQSVEVHTNTQRIDLGYKVLTRTFESGDDSQNLRSAAKFLSQQVSRSQNRTPEQRVHAQWDKAIRERILSDVTTVYHLDPNHLKEERLRIEQIDNLTRLASAGDLRFEALSPDTQRDIFELGFNLTMNLRDRMNDVKPDIAPRIQAVIDSFRQ